MKTTMKITGNISLVLLAMGTVLKICHWPGASVALLLGFVIMCTVFFPSSVYLNYREFKSKGRMALNLSAFLGGIPFMTGILFKVMHWPGASIMLLTGYLIIILVFLPLVLYAKLNEDVSSKEKRIIALGVVSIMVFETAVMFKIFHWPGASILLLLGSIASIAIFLPMYCINKYKTNQLVAGRFIFLIILSMYSVILSSLLVMNVSRNVLGSFVNGESNSSAISNYLNKKKEIQLATLNGLSDDKKTALNSVTTAAHEIYSLINSIKIELVKNAEGVDAKEATQLAARPVLLNSKDNYDRVNHYLLGLNNAGKATVLKDAIDKFRMQSIVVCSTNSALKNNIVSLLSSEQTNSNTSWEEATFRNNTMISTFDILSTLEKNIRAVECEMINYILNDKPAAK